MVPARQELDPDLEQGLTFIASPRDRKLIESKRAPDTQKMVALNPSLRGHGFQALQSNQSQ